MAGDLSNIIEAGSEFEQMATGFVFTEGPVWDSGYLYFVDIRTNLLLRMKPGEEPEVVRRETGSGDGLTFDHDGNLLMCEGSHRRLTRTNKDTGRIEIIAERWNKLRLNSPNDVIARPDGTVYFTDPPWAVKPENRQLDFAGVYRISPDGEVHMEAGDNETPNGLAMSPDGSKLYVSNTRSEPYMNVYEVKSDGSLGKGERFADIPYGPNGPVDGVPDGVKVDESGNVFCTGAGGGWVFSSDGIKIGVIEAPELPANLGFIGDNRKTLVFTSRTSVYSIRVQTPGMPVVY
jgi:gluconolactonase